ncbi:sortilin-related receptor-like isoform X2 [Xenia sp. Carnegie-2017]|uniref:sortilin-related receptor-like isoform X2 n=1 Tax=Xenia sp. Carnegie-2017 TaxID=2897299 RepID=UPI001F04F1AC|nr:sortilin-related receptor-like isoform X2 [Xenia sp. Carnegie-2017]
MNKVCAIFIFLVFFRVTLSERATSNCRAKHLFVQRDKPLRGSSLPSREIYLSSNDNETGKELRKESSLHRSRRSLSSSTNPTHTVHEFHDSHNLLIVQWSGIQHSDTVVVVTRDGDQKAKSTSYLYVSNNYGVSYQNMSHLFKYTKNGVKKQGLVNTFYSSPAKPTWYIFTDTINKVLFISKDDCKTITPSMISFTPSEITFHDSKTNGVVAYDQSTKTLYYSKNFGKTWTIREKKVVSYFWGFKDVDSDDVIYMELDNGDNTSKIVRDRWDHKSIFTHSIVANNVSDFEINDVYMFFTRKSANGLDLYVGYHYKDISKAEFPNDMRREDYMIADASEGQVFVAVNHNKNTSHLYISDVKGKVYTLSLERILLYLPYYYTNTWHRLYMKESFVDLYKVASMRGVYIASQLEYGKIGTRPIHTKISYNKGGFWHDVKAPAKHSNGSMMNCFRKDGCSLHLATHFAKEHPGYWAPPIKSRKSAPGLIVSSGNTGKRFTINANVYLSNDAGKSWLEVLQGRWYYNFVDHGGVVVAVRQWSPTKEILYSVDEGLTWKRYNFTKQHVRVYGLLTETGERTTVVTIFGSYKGRHNWIVVQVNVSNVLGRPCSKSDYEIWSPHNRYTRSLCVLGQTLKYERRKRKSVCFNGLNYDRPVNTTKCKCSFHDYECDYGFKPMFGRFFCVVDTESSFDPYAAPRPCPFGQKYTHTRGYRKIAGNKCVVGRRHWYQPYQDTCPFNVDKAFLLYAEKSSIQYMDLVNETKTALITDLSGAVAVAYDMKEKYIYWADMKEHKIKKRRFNGTSKNVIDIAGIKQVEGLDFDWTTGNLYWVDSGKIVIEVCQKDGLFRKTVHSKDLKKPRALALDPAKGDMFWSDWGVPAKIERSAMDGSGREKLDIPNLKWPNGLAIDIYRPSKSRILYYTDAKKDIIGSYDLIKKKHKILAQRTNALWKKILIHPYSIAVDDKYVYWDDWHTGIVYKEHKSFAEKAQEIIQKVPGFSSKSRYEIKVYYKRSQVDTSTCSGNSECDQLCLPTSNKDHACACSDNMFLDKNTKKCLCRGKMIKLKNGTCVHKPNDKCFAGEFACDNGRCISMLNTCDWENDCGDNSDETLPECFNNTNCPNQFQCRSDPSCIPVEYLCNDRYDCKDGEDEKGCKDRRRCSDQEFRCKNGECIEKRLRCDGYDDCDDGSDETGCVNKDRPCPNPSDFLCLDKSGCIFGSHRCNGYANCQDNSDEINCVTKCNVLASFMCVDRSRCISLKKRCDGEKDCVYDGSDEMACPRATGNTSGVVVREPRSGRKGSKSNKIIIWAVPVGVVFFLLLAALGYFVVKSRRLHRSFYRLVRNDDFDQGITYHNTGEEEDSPLIQGFSDDDPLVEA